MEIRIKKAGSSFDVSTNDVSIRVQSLSRLLDVVTYSLAVDRLHIPPNPEDLVAGMAVRTLSVPECKSVLIGCSSKPESRKRQKKPWWWWANDKT